MINELERSLFHYSNIPFFHKFIISKGGYEWILSVLLIWVVD